MITYNGKEPEKEYMCVCVYIYIYIYRKLNHFAVHLNHCKSAILQFKKRGGGFSGGAVVKNPPANAGGTGLSPGLGRSHMLQSS